MVEGAVKAWSDDEGWGVLESAEVPAEVWAHHSAIEMAGFRTLAIGQRVTIEGHDLGGTGQDGYR